MFVEPHESLMPNGAILSKLCQYILHDVSAHNKSHRLFQNDICIEQTSIFLLKLSYVISEIACCGIDIVHFQLRCAVYVAALSSEAPLTNMV